MVGTTDGHGTQEQGAPGAGSGWRRVLHRTLLAVETRVDAVRRRRRASTTPQDMRIVPYLGHGTAQAAVVRARVVDDPEPAEAVAGESTWQAVRRTIARFETDELAGVPLRVTLGEASIELATDGEGYVDVVLDAPGPLPTTDGWARATIELAAPFRGLVPGPEHRVEARVLVPDGGDGIGVLSDVDDTVLETGAQRLLDMVRTTLRGSALTRTPFPGVGELYRALAHPGGGVRRPVFYVSSSPWNLHGFLTAFLAHRDIPLGPLLLRDLGIDETKLVKGGHGEHKLRRIREVLEQHPDLRFVLVGDSGQHDPEIYSQVAREHPDRVVAVWIREVRLDPGDGRVEEVSPAFDRAGVPFLLAADSSVLAEHAVDLGLVDVRDAERVRRMVAAQQGPL